MPSDDYTTFSSGGALKLKGGKVGKHKKRKDKSTTSRLERALSTPSEPSSHEKKAKAEDGRQGGTDEAETQRGNVGIGAEEQEEDDDVEHKTEAEKRYEELQRKKARAVLIWPSTGDIANYSAPTVAQAG